MTIKQTRGFKTEIALKNTKSAFCTRAFANALYTRKKFAQSTQTLWDPTLETIRNPLGDLCTYVAYPRLPGFQQVRQLCAPMMS